MANETHVALLKRSVKEWDGWRKASAEVPDLSRARLSGAILYRTDLSDADLSGANLSRADLREANLGGANLDGANLSVADLHEAGLVGALLLRANLNGADLSGANLSVARLSGANLDGARLSGANLSWANLGVVRLRRADLREANLRGANLRNADLSEAEIGWTVFGDVDLSVAKGLDTVKHGGPSTIGIDTLYKSGGKIPEVFLRGAGIPEDFITYARSLVGKPIEFYSCFISYSSKDQQFADRLYADLQAKGVRCWFAPEDLKIGDKFRSRIDESIRLHDKLLLVLSESSIASPWVEDEVESALERERRDGTLVLFPIRLDRAVMDTDVAWAATLRRTRHIGDFAQWQEHGAYVKAFERLLRDLKSAGAAAV